MRLGALVVVGALACSPPPLPCRPARSQPPALTELLIAWETSLRLEGPSLSCLPPAESLGARVDAAGPTSGSLPVQLTFDENRTASLDIDLRPLAPVVTASLPSWSPRFRSSAPTSSCREIFARCSQSVQPFCGGRCPLPGRLAQQMTSTVPVRSSSVRKPKRVPFSLFMRSRTDATTPTTATLSPWRFRATAAHVVEA